MTFKITDTDSAGWALRKLAEEIRNLQQIKDYADRERQRIDAWEEKESQGNLGNILYFEALLENYYRDLRQADPKAKLSTPWGKVTSRTTTNWQWEDDTVLKWLKNNDKNYVKTKVTESVDKAALKKAYAVADNKVISPNGEVVEGVAVAPKTSYKIEVIE